MKRSHILFFACMLLSLVAYQQETLEEKTKRIHQKAFTIDSHTDTPLRFFRSYFDLNEKHDPYQTGSKLDIPRMQEGGLDAAFIAAFIGQGERTPEGNRKATKKTLAIIDSIYAQANRYPELVEVAFSPEDGYRLEKENKRAFYIGIENGYALGNNIERIEKFYNKGVRYITLCHTKNNDICDSSTDSAEHNGLTNFGKEVLKEMNRLGILVDVSHISDKSFFDVIKHSKTPILASHSNARAICDHPRNCTDKMLKALAKNNGVIQVCLLSDYVKKPVRQPKRDSAFDALRKKYNYFKGLSEEIYAQAVKDWYTTSREFPQIKATVENLVDHIDHIVKIAGIDHVGIGSDFDGGGGLKDCFDVSEMANITRELIKRGYSEEDIIKIWGGNFMRVFRETIAAKN